MIILSDRFSEFKFQLVQLILKRKTGSLRKKVADLQQVFRQAKKVTPFMQCKYAQTIETFEQRTEVFVVAIKHIAQGPTCNQ